MRCRRETYPGCTNEDGLLSLMNDKNLGEVGFNYFQKQVSLK